MTAARLAAVAAVLALSGAAVACDSGRSSVVIGITADLPISTKNTAIAVATATAPVV